MSNTLLQLHFDFQGPFGEEMSRQLVDPQNPLTRARLYLENLDRKRSNPEAGGIYLFQTKKLRWHMLKSIQPV